MTNTHRKLVFIYTGLFLIMIAMILALVSYLSILPGNDYVWQIPRVLLLIFILSNVIKLGLWLFRSGLKIKE
ncbi:hypothetical protein R4Y45_01370 [Holzapfeliella sp. He02]|uniref:Uncharacterized protein n=1 Tax=Holzapfeliella saturejae TaxID=3082953 RepID=A0ABU8SER2_9LACO